MSSRTKIICEDDEEEFPDLEVPSSSKICSLQGSENGSQVKENSDLPQTPKNLAATPTSAQTTHSSSSSVSNGSSKEHSSMYERSTRSSRQTATKLRNHRAALDVLRKRGRDGLSALNSDDSDTDDEEIDEMEERRHMGREKRHVDSIDDFIAEEDFLQPMYKYSKTHRPKRVGPTTKGRGSAASRIVAAANKAVAAAWRKPTAAVDEYTDERLGEGNTTDYVF